MEKTKYDVFGVAVGLEYYGSDNDYLKVNDMISIQNNNIILKDGVKYGSLAKQEKYYDNAQDVLETLLEYNTIELIGSDYAILDSNEIKDLVADEEGNTDACVVYTDNKMALLYLGTGELPEDSFNEEDLIDDLLKDMEKDNLIHSEEIDGEICYSLTEKGKTIAQKNNTDTIRKEENNMDNVFGKMGFGKYLGNRFALSMNGIAVKQDNTDKFVVYNKETNEFVDVTDLLFNIKNALFVLPTVDIHQGDIVLHNEKPYYIVSTKDEIKAVSYEDCTQTILIPKTTMFGLKYFTKVFSLFGDNFASEGELFSNPMMLMALMDNKDTDLSKMLLMSSLGKGNMESNPMLMAMLLKDGKDLDLSTFAMMSMFNGKTNPFNPKTPKNPVEK